MLPNFLLFLNHPPGDMAFVGEVGLSGEIRLCHMISDRIHEAAKLDRGSVVVPSGVKLGNFNPGKTKILQAATLMDVLHIALPAAGKGQARKAGGSSARTSGIGLPLVMPAVGEDEMVGEGDAVAIAD